MFRQVTKIARLLNDAFATLSTTSLNGPVIREDRYASYLYQSVHLQHIEFIGGMRPMRTIELNKQNFCLLRKYLSLKRLGAEVLIPS
ncbi:hypothetical protein KIN20_007481 [Parelaphostrongylus tenuis]|uniref:Uncharacterized protein n=1 Tax=Parelaphostrongylus tenuis TaxID=148309 RepID=A0AAD5MMA9_PARTN|nr:hypothetical protein KIN20_007481 [Parelaphostrongylus tenuis]